MIIVSTYLFPIYMTTVCLMKHIKQIYAHNDKMIINTISNTDIVDRDFKST